MKRLIGFGIAVILFTGTAKADTISFTGDRRVCSETTNHLKVRIPNDATDIRYHFHRRGRTTICWTEERG